MRGARHEIFREMLVRLSAQLEDAFDSMGDTIACVIVEPVAGNMNLVKASPEFLRDFRFAFVDIDRPRSLRKMNARSGLIVVTTAFSGGGSGDFFTLHILEAAPARAFDSDGKLYDRLNLTVLRSIALGDRWSGEIKIAGDTIEVLTAPSEIKHTDRQAGVQRIEARRP